MDTVMIIQLRGDELLAAMAWRDTYREWIAGTATDAEWKAACQVYADARNAVTRWIEQATLELAPNK